MSDEYQAVYDAVSHRICTLDLDIRNALASVACELKRPVVIMRPALSLDGDQWCFLLGDNLMTGVSGFGDTPAAASAAFDAAWYKRAAE